MILRRFLLVALVPLLIGAGAGFAFAQPPPAADAVPAYHIAASEEDVLVLEVHVERRRASAGILAYRAGDDFLLPLGQIADVLELAIRVDLPSRRATGWIIDEERRFQLDLDQASVEFDGHQEGLPDASVYLGYDDVYVRRDLLSQWIPADFAIQFHLMRVDITARETLPLLARLDRDRQRALLSNRGREAPLFPERRARYQTFTWPFVDLSLRGTRSDEGDLNEITALGRGDLANANASGYFRSRTGNLEQTSGWFNLQRTDLNNELLGPLRASRVVVGDLFTRHVPFVTPGRRGRGVQISNQGLNQGFFDVTEVEGAANPGWDAELYVNGTLRSFQVVDESGRYRFEDVPIQRGTTYVRVVTYGPQGQEREDTRYITVGPGARQAGRLDYDFHVAQDELSVLGTNLWNRTTDDEGAWMHHLQLGYGLTRSLGIETSIDRVPVNGEAQDLASVRLNNTIGRTLWRLEFVDNVRAGHVARLGMNSIVAEQNLLLSYTDFSAFQADLTNTSERNDWSGRARVSGSSRAIEALPLSYNLDVEHRALSGPGLLSDTSFKARGNAQYGGIQAVHEATLRRSSYDTTDDRISVLGSQLVAGYIGRTRLRASVHYAGTDAGNEIQAIGFGAQRFATPNVNVQAGVQRYMSGLDFTRYDVRVNARHDDAMFGVEFRYDSDGSYRWGLSITTSLLNRPGTRQWSLSGQRATTYGAAVAKTFIDLDGDGEFGEMDEPLPGVAFRRNQKWQDSSTDDLGRAWLTGLRPDHPVNVQIDLSSVFDPFLVPRHEGLTTIVHRGGIAELEFPFQYVGDVEGMVYRDLLRNQPMSNVGLELVDPLGNRIAATVSEFDGYYVFQKVPAGPYKIRVLASTLPHGDFILPPAQPIVVPDRGDYVEGPVFVLVREGERLDLRFAEDGSIEGVDPQGLLGDDASEAVLARLRLMLAASEERPSLQTLLDDDALDDQERRTLEILYELFFGEDQQLWIGR